MKEEKETDLIFSEGEDEMKKEKIKIKIKIRYLFIKSVILILRKMKLDPHTKK